MLRRTSFAFAFSFLAALAAASGCASSSEADADPTVEGTLEEPLTRVDADEQAAAAREPLDGLRFEHLTPTSARIMQSARFWMRVQDRDARYPKARMCASNVSKVLFLSGIYDYDQEGVRALVADVRKAGGRVLKVQQSPEGLLAALEQLDGGRLPAGTLVAGMNVNTSEPGDQHIGFVGHTDPDGTVWLYHNNWYRPENEGGARRQHMVSERNLSRGFPRQWMATPWIKIEKGWFGRVTGVRSLMPQIDDMDPFNPSFQVTLAILPEVLRELPAYR